MHADVGVKHIAPFQANKVERTLVIARDEMSEHLNQCQYEGFSIDIKAMGDLPRSPQ